MIAFTLISILIFVFLIYLLTTLFAKAKRSIFPWKKVYYFLAGYIALLCIVHVAYALIPEERFTEIEPVVEKDPLKKYDELYETVRAGKGEEADASLVEKRWEKQYPFKALYIKNDREDLDWHFSIVIERKKTNDGKIEGVLYKNAAEVKLSGFTTVIPLRPPQLKWDEDQFIIRPQKLHVHYAFFDMDDVTKQFLGRKNEQNDGHGSFEGSAFPYHLIYLRIPKDVSVINESNMNVELIGD